MDRVGAAGELPVQLAADVLSDLDMVSTAMKLGRQVPTSTRDSRLIVHTEAPDAFFVSGDYGLKQTTSATATNEPLVAEEIACLIPVPDSVVADSSYDIWQALRPLVTRAFARRLDRAIIFNEGRPSSWPVGVVAQAVAAGNTVDQTDDPIKDLLAAAGQVSTAGYNPTACAASPGYQFRAASSRSDAFNGSPVGASEAFNLAVAGLPISTDPVYWSADQADLIVADWRNVVLGVRQDLEFSFSDSGVIVDDSGQVVFSAWQQDSTIMRAVMRLGWTLVKPIGRGVVPSVPVSVVAPGSVYAS